MSCRAADLSPKASLLIPLVQVRTDYSVGVEVCNLLCCSFMMEYDIHTVLDFLTLVATVWVIYTLRIPLKDTYQEEQDSVQTYYVVG